MAAPTEPAAPETEAGAAGFQIEDRQYPVPPIDTFTFDELETLYRYCGLTITDWGRRHTGEGRVKWEEGSNKPGFYMCLVHVAYRRGNRDLPDDTVAALVRDLHWLDVMAPLLEAPGDDEDLATPGTTNVPEQSSGRKPNENESSKPGSGTSSQTGSEKAATPAVGTGTGGSDTSATPILVRQVI